MSDRTPVTRRRAIGTGTLFLGAGLLAVAGSRPVPVAAEHAPTIDHAEALLLEIIDIIPHLSERDRDNICHVLDLAGQAGPLRDFAESLEDARDAIGPGNRLHDVLDRTEAAIRRAVVTHPRVVGVVEEYAARYRAGEVGQVGTMIRAELYPAYGDELGEAISSAAFHTALHQKHGHGGGSLADCSDCWD